MPSQIPTIALVGRTNVGKSTLFNKLLEAKKALVSAIPGTTRDRKEGVCIWRGKVINIVDTGGIDPDMQDEIERKTAEQSRIAVEKADLILFVVDLKTGALPQDRKLAESLRNMDKPVIVVGNKAETQAERIGANDRDWQFGGLPSPIPVSALRGTGVGDLLDMIYDTLEEIGKPPQEAQELEATRVAVIGKPNVGKSTLLNSLFGETRFITTPIAHTTREPNDVLLEAEGKSYIFVDTAGMRKSGKVRKAGGLEQAGVERNETVLHTADVAIFVIDVTDPVGAQEKTLAGFVKDSRVGVILVANKWDLVGEKTPKSLNEYKKYLEASIPFISWAPIVFTSAETGQRVKNLLALVDKVQENRKKVIPERDLEDFWRESVAIHKPSRGKGPMAPKVLGMTQVGTEPPTFHLIIKARQTDVLHKSYLRYLENRLREKFDLIGTPISIRVKTASAVSKR